MSSATAWMPYPTIAAYAATKSFLRTFARSLNFEFRKYGVRVTGVFPGAVDTPLYDLDAACRRRLLRWGVMSAPQEVAQHGLRALFRAVAAAFRVFSRKSASVSAGWFRRG